MKYPVLLLTSLTLLLSCSTHKETHDEAEADTPALEEAEQLEEMEDADGTDTTTDLAPWADNDIITYLENNKDRLTEVDGQPVTYIKDTTTLDEKKYAVVKIGHSFEQRYVTDQWIYVDSLSHAIYEYDLPNDSLILWTPK